MSATTIPVHFRVSKDGSLHSVKLGLEAFGSASHQYASACQEAEGTLNAMTLATEGVEFKDMTTEAETQLAMKAVTAAYAKHTIEEASPGRWLLTDGTAVSPPMRGWNTRWAEVVVLAAGTLLVHGDGMDPVMFGHTYNSSAEDIVHTMACTRPDDALMIASVRTAMGRPYDVVVWEDSLRCFREELSEFIAQCVATRERAVLVDPESPHALQERGRIETMNGLLEKSRSGSDGDVPYLRRELDAVLDTTWARTPQGRVISNQMLSAWAIVCRLSEVLKGR